jgi:hypothetical protein
VFKNNGGEGTAVSGIKRFFIEGVGGAQGGGDLAAGAFAGIDEGGLAEGVEGAEIGGVALALGVGGAGAAHIGTFGPFKSQPAKICEGGVVEGGFASGSVEIVVAVYERAGLEGGYFCGFQKGGGVANVEESSG